MPASLTSTPHPAPPSPTPTTKTLSPTHITDNIFAAPDNTVLIHACNTKGSWGAGIAVAFKTFCPHAYEVYHTHCLSTPVQTGTCLLIPPCESDAGPKHWIACLFTSAAYGKKKDAPEEILRNTETAVRDLLVQVQLARGRDEMIAGLRMCRINSGRFGVEWERTEAVLRGMKIDGPGGGEIEIEVWDRGEEDL
jgi:ADP-ribose 1''-phosphate phosphatase